ncbi:MAG: 1-acyl-sn-glycerol-3-phosphate acyltransferase [Propionibacteriaceae bacterium]|nr:1-acyl-sn-glycerol-3-phosphate acyltransferase [Propionibacteriaceae bacterium]
MFYSTVKVLLTPVCFLLFWPVLKGRENIPQTGPAIFATNHLGTGESFLLVALVPPQITFPAKQELFRTDTFFRRILAWFLRRMHQVPMDRSGGTAAADAMGSVYKVLADGGFVAIHPEGHRSPDGRMYKGRTGVARLALTADAPVIPVGCFRTRFTRKWLPFPWLYRPELRVGEPFRFPQEMRRQFLDAANHTESHTVLRQATDEVMQHIQQITGQEMVDEYSYNPKGTGPGH